MTRSRLPFIILCAVFLLGMPGAAGAQSASDLQSQIDTNNRQLSELQAEIAAYQKQLDALGVKKSTLQSAISALSLEQKQLSAKIQATRNKIASANLKIRELTLSIGDKEATIAADRSAIAKALKNIAQDEAVPFAAQVIASRTLRDAWQAADAAIQFNRALENDISDLRAARTALAANRDQVTAVKNELVALQDDLTLQKRSVDANKAAQQKLLSDTKNQESLYQAQIAQKQAAEKAIEQELLDLGNQLNLIVHPERLPRVGSGVLSWPFSLAYMNNCVARKKLFGNIFCITQYFGNTAFSTANPQVYNGNGHNAIDISAPIGTPILAALGGTVLATGNTDAVKGCYSFGKWVMLVHGNGLNTLYSHLSSIDVVKGQSVKTGRVLGLSGMTGYATGPHLHFGVYATEGTQIMTLGQFRSTTVTPCKNATMPVATLPAYLNPLSYL